jgi:NtrC-family two-component system response regulator AlgB
VAAAEGGTLFLDEVGDLPLAVQPKLLRFLQEKSYERVGETRTRHGDVRLLAASNRHLSGEVRAGRFREDLYYRIDVIEVTLPPLRERRRDIGPLAGELLAFFARQTAKPITGFTREARAALERHAWPGNLRELRNAIERAVILAAGPEVGLGDLPAQITAPGPDGGPAEIKLGGATTLDDLEAEHIRRVLASSATLDDAARSLGVDPSTLYRKRKRYGL